MTELTDAAARADMRIEIVKRELNQGALAGFDSSVTDYAARLIIAALDSFDEDALKAEFRRGFELGEENMRAGCDAAYAAGYGQGRDDEAAGLSLPRRENSA